MRVVMVLLALVATPLIAGVSQGRPGSTKSASRDICNNGQGDEHRSAQGTAHAHKGQCVPQDPPPPPPAVLDTDHDGVLDNVDQCPGTPLGTTVDAFGCPVQAPPADTDLDGVPDNLDQCPGTAPGTTVDASGCAVQAPPPPPSCPVTAPSTAGSLYIEGQVLLDASPWPGLADWCIHLTGTVDAVVLTLASGNYRFTGLPSGTYTVCEDVKAGWVETFPTSGTACPTGFGWSFPLNGASASFNNFWNVTAPAP